jgi:pimeloyl-ACP methyl ester carboxylesterase
MNARLIDTDRLRVSYVESGPEDGIPVVLVHGNLSTGRFYEHLMFPRVGQLTGASRARMA